MLPVPSLDPSSIRITSKRCSNRWPPSPASVSGNVAAALRAGITTVTWGSAIRDGRLSGAGGRSPQAGAEPAMTPRRTALEDRLRDVRVQRRRVEEDPLAVCKGGVPPQCLHALLG